MKNPPGLHQEPSQNHYGFRDYETEALSVSDVSKLSFIQTDLQDVACRTCPKSPENHLQSQITSVSSNIVASQPQRTDTPSDLDYRQIGDFKLGSLRITNGAASPALSRERLNESESGTQSKEKNNHPNFSSADNSLSANGLQSVSHYSKKLSSLQKDNELQLLGPDAYSLFNSKYHFRDFDIKDFEFGGDFSKENPAQSSSVHEGFTNNNPLSPYSNFSSKLSSLSKKNRTTSKLNLVMNDRSFEEEQLAQNTNLDVNFLNGEVQPFKPPVFDEAYKDGVKPLPNADSDHSSSVSFPWSQANEQSPRFEADRSLTLSPISDSYSFASSISFPEKLITSCSNSSDGKNENISRKYMTGLERQKILFKNENRSNFSSSIEKEFESKFGLSIFSNDNVLVEVEEKNMPGKSLPLLAPAIHKNSIDHDLSFGYLSNVTISTPLHSHPPELAAQNSLPSHSSELSRNFSLPNAGQKVVNCSKILPPTPTDDISMIEPNIFGEGSWNDGPNRKLSNYRRLSGLEISQINLEKVSERLQKTKQEPTKTPTRNISQTPLKNSLITTSLDRVFDRRKTHTVEKTKDNAEGDVASNSRAIDRKAFNEYELAPLTSELDGSKSNLDTITHGTHISSLPHDNLLKNADRLSAERDEIRRSPLERHGSVSAYLRKTRFSQPQPCRSRSSPSTLTRRSTQKIPVHSASRSPEKEASCFPLFSRPEYRQRPTREVGEIMTPLFEEGFPALTGDLFKLPPPTSSKDFADTEKQESQIDREVSQYKEANKIEKQCSSLIHRSYIAASKIKDKVKANEDKLLGSQFKSSHETHNTFSGNPKEILSPLSRGQSLSITEASDNPDLLNNRKSKSTKISEKRISLLGLGITKRIHREKEIFSTDFNYKAKVIKDEENLPNSGQKSYEVGHNSKPSITAMTESLISFPSQLSLAPLNRLISNSRRSSAAKSLTTFKPCHSSLEIDDYWQAKNETSLHVSGAVSSLDYDQTNHINENILKKSNSTISDSTIDSASDSHPKLQRQDWRVRSSNDFSRTVSPKNMGVKVEKNSVQCTKSMESVMMRKEKYSETTRPGKQFSNSTVRPEIYRHRASFHPRRSFSAYPPQAHVTRRSSLILAKSSRPVKAPDFYTIIEKKQKEALLTQTFKNENPLSMPNKLSHSEKKVARPAICPKKIKQNEDLDQRDRSHKDKISILDRKSHQTLAGCSTGALFSQKSYENPLNSDKSQQTSINSSKSDRILFSGLEDQPNLRYQKKILSQVENETHPDVLIDEDVCDMRDASRDGGNEEQNMQSKSTGTLNQGQPISHITEMSLLTKLTETPLISTLKSNIDSEIDAAGQNMELYDEKFQYRGTNPLKINTQSHQLASDYNIGKSIPALKDLESLGFETQQGSATSHSRTGSKYRNSLDSLPSQKLTKNGAFIPDSSSSLFNHSSVSESSTKCSTQSLKIKKNDNCPAMDLSIENQNRLKIRDNITQAKTPVTSISIIPKNVTKPPTHKSSSSQINIITDQPSVSSLHESGLPQTPLINFIPVQYRTDESFQKTQPLDTCPRGTDIKDQNLKLNKNGSCLDSLPSQCVEPSEVDLVVKNNNTRNSTVNNSQHNLNTTRLSIDIQCEQMPNELNNKEQRQNINLCNSQFTSNGGNSVIYGSAPNTNNFPTIPKSIRTFYQGLHQPSMDFYHSARRYAIDTQTKTDPSRIIEDSYGKKIPKVDIYHCDEKEIIVLNSGWRKRDVLNGSERASKYFHAFPDSMSSWSEKAVEICVDDIWEGTDRINS